MQRLKDRDFMTAVVLLGIGTWFLASTEEGVKDWIFPLLAIYLMLGVAVALLAKFVVTVVLERAPDIIEGFGENRMVVVDLLVFGVIVLAYIVVMSGIGFWLSSFLMLLLTSIYLTTDKTRRSLIMAVAVPLGTCILAYVIFLHVFYVPLPEASWFGSGS
jgi:hypothetical protein